MVPVVILTGKRMVIRWYMGKSTDVAHALAIASFSPFHAGLAKCAGGMVRT